MNLHSPASFSSVDLPSGYPNVIMDSASSTHAKTNDEVPKKKRGNQGDFHGARLEWLEANLQAYQGASQTGTTRVWFNEEFFPNYWKQFHWSLPLNKDPLPGDVYPNDPENIEVKSAAMKAATKVSKYFLIWVELNHNYRLQKIKSWFNYRRNTLHLNAKKDPWAQWLSQLGRPLDGPPHRPHNHQYYMRHPKYKPKVTEAFNKEWPTKGLDESYKMAFRCSISERLLALETDEFRERLTAEVDAEHKIKLQQYKQGISIANSEDERDREE